jgi:hypothetical protein
MRALIALSVVLAATWSTLASAETVQVKYRGPVDVSRFDCQSGASSVVWRTCYDAKNRYLLVNLKGVYYHYCGIPAGVVAAWRGSDSLGRYFGANVKGQFDCRVSGSIIP